MTTCADCLRLQDQLAAANQRVEAAEAAMAEAKRDCPPSGILQEWQPWNGK